MWIVKFAWKNLWRNRTRTLITIAAISFAVILSTLSESLKKGVFDNLVKNVVSFYTGHIQVHKAGYQDEQILDNGFVMNTALASHLAQHKNTRIFTPRIESFALASSHDQTKGCLISGIQPEVENEITALKNKIIKGQFLLETDVSVLLSEGLAARLKLSVNDTIYLVGQGYHGSTAAGKYPVKGIVKFGSPQLNDKILFMSLPAAQQFLSAEGIITSYIISLKNNNELDESTASIREHIGPAYEVLSWEELLPDIKQHISTDSNNMKIVQGILYFLICFGIFSTVLIMMTERKFEMGMLVAIGMKKNRLVLLFIAESVITAIIGCLAGIAAAIPLTFYLEKHPVRIGGETAEAFERWGFEAIFPTSTEPSIYIYQAFIVLVIGLLLSIYPLVKVWQLNPLTAMKR